MTSEKLKPTPGPWYYNSLDEWDHSVVTRHGETDDGSTRLWTVASANINRDEKEDNARLIAEAGTVFHECGLSPRELLEGYRELRRQLDEMSDLAIKVDSWESFPQRPIDSACAALAKHKEV